MRSTVRGLAYMLAIVAAAATAGLLWLTLTDRVLDTGSGVAFDLTVQATGSDTWRIAITALAAVLVFIPAALVLLAWPRQQRLVSLSAAGMHAVQVPAKTLERHVEEAVLGVEHIEGVDAHVKQEGDDDVALGLDIRVDADAETSTVMSVVEQRVASALAQPYGITTRRKPNVSIRHTGRHSNGSGEAKAA